MRKFFSPHCRISKWEIFMVISSNFNMSEIYFHNKDLASRLSLKEGLRRTRKWPTHSGEGLKLETSPSGISIRLYFQSRSQSSRYPCPAKRETRESRVSRFPFRWKSLSRTLGTRFALLPQRRGAPVPLKA